MWADLKQLSRSVWRRETPLESVRATVARYVSGFAENVDLWRLLDEMSVTNPRFTELRDEYRRQFVQKIERGIESSGTSAHIEGMQPAILAELLAGMVDEACAVRYLRGRTWPEDDLVEHITIVWGRAVGYLSSDEGASTPESPHR
jgi:AcrR family transcriptional regulator